MAKLPSLSSRQIIAALRRAGFLEAPHKGKGSHRAFYLVDASGRTRLVIVPHGKDIPRGTLAAILSQAGLDREEFRRLL